jgi:hypothetical protein
VLIHTAKARSEGDFNRLAEVRVGDVEFALEKRDVFPEIRPQLYDAIHYRLRFAYVMFRFRRASHGR